MPDLKIRILGSVSLEVDDQPATLGGHRQRVVLASLVVRLRRPVPVDVLIDDLWGESPPRTARNSIQRFVSDLRRALDSAGDRLETVDGGYRLLVDDEEVDGYQFEALIERARRATDPSEKVEVYVQALDLWEGRPFEGVESRATESERIRLEELHAAAEEGWARSLIDVGGHLEAIPELERMVAEAPLREQRWSLLMLGLYRSGRQAEALRAFQKARATLVDELGIEPSAELARLEERILDQDPELRPQHESDKARPSETAANPYKGLEAFTPVDEAIFYGREELTERILRRMEWPGLIALVGASGSGKSSVVLAGVVPAIKRGTRPGSGEWPIIIMHPSAHPLEELASATRAVVADEFEGTADEIDPDSVEAALAHTAVDGDGLLLVVDQLEELFVLSSETVQKQFMDTLVRLSRSSRIVVTLRADFYDKPLVHREFARLMADGMETVMPLSPAELERAVTRPAASVGVNFDPALVAEIVDDVGDQPGALPLLQYALTEVFDKRSGNIIDIDDYDRVGGVAGALTVRGEEVWRTLSDEQRKTARSLLLQLVAVSDTGAIVRRPMPLTYLDTIDNPDAANQVVNALIESRLVSVDRKLQNEVPVLEVAHEALLREWTRLRAWVDQETENLRTHRRLEAAAAEWELADRDQSFLLTGSRLERIEEWRSESDFALTPSQQAYIEASRERHEAEDALEQQRRDRELDLKRRSVRRLRLLVGVMALAIVVAAGLTAFALLQRSQAEERSAELSVRSLAGTALAEFASNPELSLLLAIEAAHISQDQLGVMVPVVEEALHRGLTTPQPLMTIADGGSSLDFSPDGSLVAVGRLDGSIDVISSETLESISRLEGHEARINEVAFDSEGARLASASADGTVRLWDVDSRLFLRSLPHTETVTDIAWSEDGSLMLAGSGTSALVWDVDEAEVVDVVNVTTGGDIGVYVGWISDRIAVSASGPVVIWDVGTGGSLARVHGLVDFGICALTVDQGAGLIYFGDLGGGVRSAQIASGEDAIELIAGDRSVRHDGPACALDAGPGGQWAHGGADGRVVIMDAEGTELRAMSHGGEVSEVRFDPDGTILASTGTTSGGVTQVWAVEEQLVGELGTFAVNPPVMSVSVEGDLVGATGPNQVVVRSVSSREIILDSDQMQNPGAVSISVNGSMAIGVSESGLIEVTFPERVVELVDLDSIAVILAFNETGTRLLGADVEGNVALWDLENEKLAAVYEAIPLGPFSGPMVAASQVGDAFVVIEEGPTAVVRSFEDGEEMSRFPIEATNFSALSFDSTTLAVGSETDEVTLWDTDTGEQTVRLPTTAVTAMTMIPGMGRLLTGGVAGELIVWDTADGSELFRLPAVGQAILAMDASSGGKLGVVGDAGGNIRVLALTPDLLLSTAESRVTRALTAAECQAYLALSECPERG